MMCEHDTDGTDKDERVSEADTGREAGEGAANDLEGLRRKALACRLCRERFGFEPRPVLRVSATARILIAGQAPGVRVHNSGIPWNDPSGRRLREWLGLDEEIFYDERHIAILPQGLCYPGDDGKGGDRPPPAICARTWHGGIIAAMRNIELKILAGAHAHAFHLGERRRENMTETVRHWRDYAPGIFPLPHPSWRNNAWLKRNPFFEAELLPALRERIRDVLNGGH